MNRRWQANKGPAILVGAVAIALILVLASTRGTIDPVFVCSSGKHFDMRIVEGVATLGCFE